MKMLNPRLSLIAALDTEGNVFFSLLHANTDSNMIRMFLSHLFDQLDAEIPNWRETSVVLLDGAKYHTSEECINFLKASKVEAMFSAPYSYGKYRLYLSATAGYHTTIFSYSYCADRAAVRQLQTWRSLRSAPRSREEVSKLSMCLFADLYLLF